MRISALLLIGLLLVTACSQQNRETAPNEIIERVRPAAEGGTTAAYFVHQNSFQSPDTLLSIRSDISEVTQVHETYKTENGMMGMREQSEIIVPPGQSVEFRQGGLHVMLINIGREISQGDSVILNMEWSESSSIRKKLPVQP